MLLRLIPNPSTSLLDPPTILFTLPLPSHPYTSRALPLPPNLLAHQSVCLQEDIECSNVLLGEKSSWIAGMIDDVTFSLPNQSVAVNFIDGTVLDRPLEEGCLTQLANVVNEVHLSFTASTKPVEAEHASPRASSSFHSSAAPPSSRSSISSGRPSISIPQTLRQSPSSLLLSLFSPLLFSPSPDAAPYRASASSITTGAILARSHRRQARSLLVDTYCRYVVPTLKAHLPQAYLPWIIASETARKMEEFEEVQERINAILKLSRVTKSMPLPAAKHCRSASSSTMSDSDSDSDSDSVPFPVTPATSIFTGSNCSSPAQLRRASSPQAFMLSIPPTHALPSKHHLTYSAQLARLTQIASRLQAVKKLQTRYEREEGKRRWLESLEAGRLYDRAVRRAVASGVLPRVPGPSAVLPQKRSGLWRSTTAEDLQRAVQEVEVHPAMMEADANEDSVSFSDSAVESDSEFTENVPPRRPSLTVGIALDPQRHVKSPFEDTFGDTLIRVRAVGEALAASTSADLDEEDDTPGLVTSRSHDSLSSICSSPVSPTEERHFDLLPPSAILLKQDASSILLAPLVLPRPSKALPEIDWNSNDVIAVHIEEAGRGIQVIRA